MMAFNTWAARSSGRTEARAPPNDPMGVRMASIITGVGMKDLLKLKIMAEYDYDDFTILVEL
jgi:hypothetical protein